MSSQPDMHYHWSSSQHCSMMSSQITVWALWIVALNVARRCSLKWFDVWRLHFIGLFPPVLGFSYPLTHPLSFSSLFPPTHVSVQQRAVAVRQHHGGWMCGCRGDWECCLRTPGWTRKWWRPWRVSYSLFFCACMSADENYVKAYRWMCTESEVMRC